MVDNYLFMNIPDYIQFENADCPMGCPKKDKLVLTGHDLLHGLPGIFEVVECACCGLLRTNPRPTPETIGFYYPDDYGPYRNTQISFEKLATNESPLKRFARLLYKAVFKFNTQEIPAIPVGRMLEIGCASGAFLAKMAHEGWQVEGIEFSASAAASARANGFKVFTGTLEQAVDPHENLDLIVGWMVVEHLHHPVEALSKLARWSKPDGWLAISVPNVASLDFKIFGSSNYALHLPNHLYHFTPDTLSALLEKSGWRVEKISHHRTLSNWIASIGNKLELASAPTGLVRLFKQYPGYFGVITLLLYPLAWLFAAFGQTGRMTVWARRIG